MITSITADPTMCNIQVHIGAHAFTFDHVYGSSGSLYSSIFEECVLPLIDALFHGYNATIFAYGQVVCYISNFTFDPFLMFLHLVLTCDLIVLSTDRFRQDLHNGN